MLIYEIYAATHPGMVRKHNEDCYMVNHYFASEGEFYLPTHGGDLCVAVADGIGGGRGGEIASALTLETISKMVFPAGPEDILKLIKDSNTSILRYAEESEMKGMGTTLCGLICSGRDILTFNLGDSRVYRYRNGYITPVTKDHTLAYVMFEQGEISFEDIRNSTNRSIIYNYVGRDPDSLQIDQESFQGRFEAGDVFLVCTDGLYGMVTEEEIGKALQEEISLQQAVVKLIAQANENGGKDNITVVAVKKLS